jgi:acetyl esterase/lipase
MKVDTFEYAYGPHASQLMQLYLPTGSHLSVVVVIHGGYWRSTYGMELAEPLGRDLTRYGVAAAVIEYRRVGEGGGWPTTLADVARAVDSLALQGQFVAEGRLQLDRVAAIGHSAGGHLAVRAAADVPLTGVVSQAGALDLYELWRRGTSDDVVRQFLGGSPDEVPDVFEAATPRPPSVPLLLVHGALDEDVPVEISRDFGAGDLVVVEDEGHMEHLDTSSQCWRAVIEWL